MSHRPFARPRGFSLVEVVTALGIVTICVLTLMGLLAVGVKTNKTTINQSIAVNIADAVAADLRAAPLVTQSYAAGAKRYAPRFGFQVPAPGNGIQTVFVSDEGTPLTSPNTSLTTGPTVANGTVSYRVTVQGPSAPTTANQRTASPVFILVTWPGAADPNAASWPSAYAGSFQVITYIDQN